MVIEQLRRLYEAQPFRPFTMHLADGRQLPVLHREFLAISPSGRTSIVYQPDESFNIVDLLLVTDLEVRPEGRPKPNGRRKRRPG
jgi:hypothetical protein